MSCGELWLPTGGLVCKVATQQTLTSTDWLH